jgi:hypothetical protein
MTSVHRPSGWLIGAALAAGAAGVILAFAGISTPARVPLVLLFLAVVPGVAVASLLDGIDAFARTVIAGASAIVIDLSVAAVMIASGTWSARTGLAAVAVVSGLIVIVHLLVRKLAAARSERSSAIPSRARSDPLTAGQASLARVPSDVAIRTGSTAK